jgi:hypothetical protein
MGTLVFTNLRAAWFSKMTETFNLSVPFIIVEAVTRASARVGTVLAIETRAARGIGAALLAFRFPDDAALGAA